MLLLTSKSWQQFNRLLSDNTPSMSACGSWPLSDMTGSAEFISKIFNNGQFATRGLHLELKLFTSVTNPCKLCCIRDLCNVTLINRIEKRITRLIHTKTWLKNYIITKMY